MKAAREFQLMYFQFFTTIPPARFYYFHFAIN